MKKVLTLIVVALVAVPGSASAGQRHAAAAGEAAQACQAERSADAAAFQAKYANRRGRHAFRRCVRQHVRAAKRTCRSERRGDRAAFRAKYGDAQGRHAFRRCVRQHAGESA